MTQRELRNIIVKQLHTYLAGPKVVLSDQTAPEADYPLIYYQSVQQYRNQINHATDSVENTQSRSAFDTDETDRRYGFDVLFRYEREDKRAVPAISKPPITFTKEE